MNNIVEPGLHERFEKMRTLEEGKRIIQSVNFSKQTINKVFNFIKGHMVLLEKNLKINNDSVIRMNQEKLAEQNSQLILEERDLINNNDPQNLKIKIG